jgi:apolipoprotein N-acyltransferase
VAAYVVTTFLAFPQPLAGGVLDLGVWIAWLCPAFLLLSLEGLTPGRAARQAFVAAILAHAAVLHWVYVVSVRYGGAPAPLGVLAPFVPAGYMAMCIGLMGYAWSWLRSRGVGGPVVAALLFVATDHLRTFLFGGLPWATLGYTQHANVGLLPLVTLTGVLGLGFVVALGGAGLAGVIRCRLEGSHPSRIDGAAVVAVPLIHLLVWIGITLPEKIEGAPEPGPTLRVAAVQGDIDQLMKWDKGKLGKTVNKYIRLSEEAVARGAQVVVWPETAVPGPLEYDPPTQSRLRRFVREEGVALVVGSVGVELDERRERIDRFYDSAFLFDSSGRMAPRYDKTHLVPFGEYVPLRWLLAPFIGAVASGMASDDVSAGPAPRAIELSLPAAVEGDPPVRVGVPICYELLFPDLVRRFVADGAQLLLAITNDAWYGDTGAPHQFLAMTAMRSAETRTWTVRAANTGVSAIIDDRGHVQQSTELFEPGFVLADVPLRAADATPTFYVRFGDVFAWLCWAALAAIVVRAATMRARSGPETPRGPHGEAIPEIPGEGIPPASIGDREP